MKYSINKNLFVIKIKKELNNLKNIPNKGIIYLYKEEGELDKWKSFNNKLELPISANALVALTRYKYDNKEIEREEIYISKSTMGIVKSKVKENLNVEILLPMPTELQIINNNTFYLNTGIKHIIKINDTDEYMHHDVKKLTDEFNASVSYVWLNKEEGLYNIRTFDKYSELESPGCGDGMIAAAFILKNNFIDKKEYFFKPASGKTSKVKFNIEKGVCYTSTDIIKTPNTTKELN